MRLDTALREYARQKLQKIGRADIVVGIPCYNSEETVGHVVRTVAAGLARHYPDRAAVLVISDGGSLDDTRETVQAIAIAPPIHKIVTIYRGLPGKGTSLRAVFEAVIRLQAKACAVFDSDLRSITPEWVPALVAPVLDGGHDFVSPLYARHKWDATITNNIARALTQALYGRRLHQPIGGDFGFSEKLAEWFARADVWGTDVAKFGIDIWMTTVAICEGFRVCEAFLGTKIHAPKDPAASLGPMFRQVVGTIFGMMSRYEHVWRRVRGSEPVPVVGQPHPVDPPEVRVSLDRLVDRFSAGFRHFGALWREVLGPNQFAELERLSRTDAAEYTMSPVTWARIVYDFAYTYHRWSKDRYKLVEIMTPAYYARIAAFVLETQTATTAEADRLVDEQSAVFEQEKGYFLERIGSWERLPPPGGDA